MKKEIRIVALGILQRPDGKLLVDKGYDSIKKETFYRPLGGGVDFGEKSEEALVREFMEETGKEIVITKFMATVENIFEYEGKRGHQVMFLHKCVFKNKNDHDLKEIPSVENKNNTSVWKSIEEIRNKKAKLYPVEIEKLLSSCMI